MLLVDGLGLYECASNGTDQKESTQSLREKIGCQAYALKCYHCGVGFLILQIKMTERKFK